MRADTIYLQVREAAEKISVHTARLQTEDHLTYEETEELIGEVEKLYRVLSVYSHLVKKQEMTGDLQVHMKIMQTVSDIESNVAAEKIVETPKEEKKTEQPREEKGNPILRQIELSINNRFRIANELFAQNQAEFQAAMQQLNSISSQPEASRYLESLKDIYKWKDENPLVKSFYALVQKRFS
jgi:hypothetical protein